MQPQATKPKQQHRQTVAAAQNPDSQLKIQTVVELTGLSESSIRRKVAAELMPPPIKDGTRCTRWIASDITAWLRSRGGATQ